MVKNAGFTLVELMITLALLAFLLMVAVPFTSAWSNGAQQQTAASLLGQGIGRAKALALRNPGGVTEAANPSAALCLADKTLTLHLIQSGGSINCSTSSIWSAKLPDNPLLKVAGNDFACLAFNNRGLPVTPSGSNCTSTEIAVSAGSQDDIQIPII